MISWARIQSDHSHKVPSKEVGRSGIIKMRTVHTISCQVNALSGQCPVRSMPCKVNALPCQWQSVEWPEISCPFCRSSVRWNSINKISPAGLDFIKSLRLRVRWIESQWYFIFISLNIVLSCCEYVIISLKWQLAWLAIRFIHQCGTG